ncbi:MAG: MerR family transcriptional regulator [Oscillospiraceae bacterium]|nr:MerR family transcriptional regulator [Oscillospiraceae bacterium]
MKISDVAKRTGVTVRTLHYYDEIGLLPPSSVTASGYRVYSDADLEALQQILFFRELAGGMNISPVAHPKNENISKQKIKWT